jgi:hypothetical protein
MPTKHPVLISKNNSRRPSEAVIQYPEPGTRLSYAGIPGVKSGIPGKKSGTPASVFLRGERYADRRSEHADGGVFADMLIST